MPHGWMLAPLDQFCAYCGAKVRKDDTVWYREGQGWIKRYCEICGVRQEDEEAQRARELKEKADADATR